MQIPLRFLRYALIGFLGMVSVGLFAQNLSHYPLRDKTVAVYFSKKQFTFDDTYRIPLAQFIKSDEGENADIEDIKLQTLVALGTLFSMQLQGPADADSVYFLNEAPDLAMEFIKHYSSDDGTLEPLGKAFARTDYILVLNPITLTSYKTSSVYSRSNRIVTEQIVVKMAHVALSLFDPKTGQNVQTYVCCIDDRKTKVGKPFFEFHMQSSRTGQFLAKFFSLAVTQMNEGIADNCPAPEPIDD
jgi:hypothetical protein